MKKYLFVIILLLAAGSAVQAHMVRFFVNGTQVDSISVNNGDSVSLSMASSYVVNGLEQFNYPFAGWSTDSWLDIRFFAAGTPVTSDLNLYAAFCAYQGQTDADNVYTTGYQIIETDQPEGASIYAVSSDSATFQTWVQVKDNSYWVLNGQPFTLHIDCDTAYTFVNWEPVDAVSGWTLPDLTIYATAHHYCHPNVIRNMDYTTVTISQDEHMLISAKNYVGCTPYLLQMGDTFSGGYQPYVPELNFEYGSNGESWQVEMYSGNDMPGYEAYAYAPAVPTLRGLIPVSGCFYQLTPRLDGIVSMAVNAAANTQLYVVASNGTLVDFYINGELYPSGTAVPSAFYGNICFIAQDGFTYYVYGKDELLRLFSCAFYSLRRTLLDNDGLLHAEKNVPLLISAESQGGYLFQSWQSNVDVINGSTENPLLMFPSTPNFSIAVSSKAPETIINGDTIVLTDTTTIDVLGDGTMMLEFDVGNGSGTLTLDSAQLRTYGLSSELETLLVQVETNSTISIESDYGIRFTGDFMAISTNDSALFTVAASVPLVGNGENTLHISANIILTSLPSEGDSVWSGACSGFANVTLADGFSLQEVWYGNEKGNPADCHFYPSVGAIGRVVPKTSAPHRAVALDDLDGGDINMETESFVPATSLCFAAPNFYVDYIDGKIDITTGFEMLSVSMENPRGDNRFYDILGREIEEPQSGLYISNGKVYMK